MTSNRSLLVIGGGVLALAVITTLVVLLAGGRASVELPESAPEGVVQRYLAAWDDEDFERAHGYFSAAVQESMDLEAYEEAARGHGPEYGFGQSRRVLLDGSEIDGNTAIVSLRIEQFSGDALGGSTYHYGQEIRMVREGDAWRIDEPLIWLDPAPYLEAHH